MEKIVLSFSFLVSIYFLFNGKLAFAKEPPLRLYFNASEKVFSESFSNTHIMKDGKKIPTLPSVNLEKLTKELKRYEKKLCFSDKLSFKLWAQISAGFDIKVLTNKVDGGLEILVDCSK